MKPAAHLVGSAVSAWAVGTFMGSLRAGIACFTAGVFIDLDHVIDYIRRRRKRRLGIKDFFRTFDWGPQGRLFLIFHAWEFLPLILLSSFLPGCHDICLGIFWGIFIHLIMDQLMNLEHPWTYFLCYRWACKFDYSCFFSRPVPNADRGRGPQTRPEIGPGETVEVSSRHNG